MKIKDLKEAIKDLPDNLDVVINYDRGYVNPARIAGVILDRFLEILDLGWGNLPGAAPTVFMLDVWGPGDPMEIIKGIRPKDDKLMYRLD